jgi:hypothetical protein
MPNATTVKKAKRDLAQGKSQSTAAGEFIREEIHHIREGKHGAKNTKQAIAIGLSQARRAGIMTKPPGTTASKETKKKAAQDQARAGKTPDPKKAWSSLQARRKEPHEAASSSALSSQAKEVAEKRRRHGGGHLRPRPSDLPHW